MTDLRGQYRLLRELGRGGMAVVHEAEHVALGRRAAVKTLHDSLAGNELSEARFAREARIAATLRHPHVVEVYDFAPSPSGPYLAIELAERGSMASLLKERGALPLSLALELILPIASGLAHAHERGVVHRDMKPANILLAADRAGGMVPKICDFGIGKVYGVDDEKLTADGAILGTLAYIPPEQLRAASSAGPAADQYSLAAILYETLTGRLLYGPAPTLDWIQRILDGGATPPSQIRPELPPALDDVVLRALSVDPEARYDSVAAFAAELLSFASGRTWTTWAQEFGAARQAERITADDDSRAGLPPGLLVPARRGVLRGRRAKWALGWGAIATFAAGFAVSSALRSEVAVRGGARLEKASKEAPQYLATRDVMGVEPAGAADEPGAHAPPALVSSASSPGPRAGALVPSWDERDTHAGGDPSHASSEKPKGRSYGSNRAPILE